MTTFKKVILYTTAVLFYLFTPLCLFAIYNTGVSLEYEVYEARIFVDIKDKPAFEKEESLKKIKKHENELKRTLHLWEFGLFAFPISATTLIILRRRLTSSFK
jgi:Ca2+/Na+ antiporter